MRKVIVIGGGIGGLTAALMLQKNGFAVEIYEQATFLSPIGAGFGVGSNALTALHKAGIGREIEVLGQPLTTLDFLDDKGIFLNELDVTIFTRKYGLSSLAIHRADLHHTLLSAIMPETIYLNKRCISFEQTEEKITVYFSDETKAEADLLIAADGLHSLFRQTLFPNSKPRYAGYTCWRGIVHSLTNPRGRSTATELWGSAGRFGIVPLKGERVYWFACVNAPQHAQVYKQYGREELAHHFKDFPTYVQNMILVTPTNSLLHHDIADIKPLSTFVFGRIVLLGDAAHATTPNMGQGAGQAIEDGIVLANCLVAEETLEAALLEYDRKRVARTKKIITMSRHIGKGAQLRHPVTIWLRNQLFKRVPSRWLLRRFQYLLDVHFG